MVKRLSIKLQLPLFLILLAVAGALWVGRDQVQQVFASLTNGEAAKRGANGRSARNGDQKVPVVVARAGEARNDVTVEAVGTGRARRSVTLFPKSNGEIVSFEVQAGDRVKRGQTIFRLDTEDAELAVKLARANLAQAESLMSRAEQLLNRNVSSQANVEDARNAQEQAQVLLRQAESTLADRTLKAPFDGIVGIPRSEVGDRVTTTSEIVTLDDRSELFIEFDLPELYLPRLDIGHEVMARTPGFDDRTFTGRIDQIDSRVDPATRSVNTRVVLPNPDDLLRPGMSFSVFVTLSGETFPTVPELALLWSDGESYVWRVTDSKAERVGAKIIRRLNNVILVEGNLAKDDLVVVEGVQRLRPGREVSFPSPGPQRTSLRNQTEVQHVKAD